MGTVPGKGPATCRPGVNCSSGGGRSCGCKPGALLAMRDTGELRMRRTGGLVVGALLALGLAALGEPPAEELTPEARARLEAEASQRNAEVGRLYQAGRLAEATRAAEQE